MKVKHRIFGLYITIFTLCGCTSSVAFYTDTLVLKQQISDEIDFQVVKETVVTVSDEMPEMEYAEYDGGDGLPWVASYVEGTPETTSEDFLVTYDANGVELSRTPVLDSTVVTPAVAPKMQFGGTISVGSEFYPKITTYGVDCYGCHVSEDGYGGTSVGVSVGLHSVRQPDGNMQEGITYGGYYIVAADPNIPLCSIVTIYDHGFSGDGLQEGIPFQAIVLDRGGAIKGAKLDLFKGSEQVHNISINRAYSNPKVVIERVGGRVGRACAV